MEFDYCYYALANGPRCSSPRKQGVRITSTHTCWKGRKEESMMQRMALRQQTVVLPRVVILRLLCLQNLQLKILSPGLAKRRGHAAADSRTSTIAAP